MLTCPNCGSDNRYGAIFCRGCGKKLDIIDEITVENINEKMGGKKRKKKKKDKSELTPKELNQRRTIINAIRIAVILLITAAVYLTQNTPPVSAIPTSDASRRSFSRKRSQLESAIKDKKAVSVTVTERELNSYMAGLMSRIEGGKLSKLDNMQVILGDSGEQLVIRMYVRVLGKKTLFQMFGKLEKKNGHVSFSPSSFAKVGKLPYPSFLMKLHCRKALSDLGKEKDLLEKLSEASVKDLKFTPYTATVSKGKDSFCERLDLYGYEWEALKGDKVKIFVGEKSGTSRISTAAREARISTPRLVRGKTMTDRRIVLKANGK